MKFLMLSLCFYSHAVLAADLNCMAGRQKEGQQQIEVPMSFTGVNSITNEREYRAKIDGYQYKVDWDKERKTLSTSVILNLKSHVYGTLAAPNIELGTYSNLDATRDDGERVSISCSMK